jgi:hypothetical protein
MESTTHKQLAQSATQNANQANIKASTYNRELDSLGEDDGSKQNSLKSKILSLQNEAQGYHAEAAGHRADASSAEIKENVEAFKEIEKEQHDIQKEQQKQEEKLEKESEEKSKPKESKFSFDGKANSSDDLLFLNESRDIGSKVTGDKVAFTTTPTQAKDQAIDSGAKSTKDEESIKGAGAAATGS